MGAHVDSHCGNVPAALGSVYWQLVQNIYEIVKKYLLEINKEKKQEIVFIDIADSLKYKSLIELIDACRATGFSNVNIIKQNFKCLYLKTL